jgi:CRISPR/Cas system-associated exonuclease Cas4 (RecB family)
LKESSHSKDLISSSAAEETGSRRQSKFIYLLDGSLNEINIQMFRKITIINVTDLVYCPRKVVFKRVNPKLEIIDEIKNLSRGKFLHTMLQQFLLQRFPHGFEFEKQVQYNCSNFCSELSQEYVVYVIGKVDVFNEAIGPWEIKTSNSKNKLTKPHPYHIQQEKYYMAMTNSLEGGLLYVQLDPSFKNDPYVEFPIKMTDDELYAEHKKLISRALSLETALSAMKPEVAQHIAYDRDLDWLCKTCSYSNECMKMRIATNGFKATSAV